MFATRRGGRILGACLFLMLCAPTLAHCGDQEATPASSPRGAYMASQCKEAMRCPLFDEVYAATPAFRHALSLSLRHGGEEVPGWVKDKLPRKQAHGDASVPPAASAMLPLRIDDRSYLLGRMTDPENPAHLIVALYDTERGFASVHYVNKEGTVALLGDDTDILRRVITDYLNADSPFARSLSQPGVALPIPVSGK